MEQQHKGLRFNSGKKRYDLVPEDALDDIVKVLTKGSEKYEDRNWEKGMAWSTVRASLGRHLAAYDACKDFDEETKLLHMAHVATNAMFLLRYYRTYPQGDDRPHRYLNMPRIGLDVDEVIADWVGHWTRYHGQSTPEFWNFDRNIKQKFDALKDNKEFWLSIPPKIDPKTLPFEPCCYITSRSIPTEWTEEWIERNGFPTMPVYTVPHDHSKVEVAKQARVDWFVDDRYENFVDMNRGGITCFLLEAPHNLRYRDLAGYKYISSLSDLFSGNNLVIPG